jgi:hypothetical protein
MAKIFTGCKYKVCIKHSLSFWYLSDGKKSSNTFIFLEMIFLGENKYFKVVFQISEGDVAQMVERSLSMREAPGSMPGFST